MQHKKYYFGKTIEELSNETGISVSTLYYRIHNGYPKDKIFYKGSFSLEKHSIEDNVKTEVIFNGKKMSFYKGIRLATRDKSKVSYSALKNWKKYDGLTVQETFDKYVTEFTSKWELFNGTKN